MKLFSKKSKLICIIQYCKYKFKEDNYQLPQEIERLLVETENNLWRTRKIITETEVLLKKAEINENLFEAGARTLATLMVR